MLRFFVNCAKTVLQAVAMAPCVNNTPPFLHFQIAKGGKEPLRTCQLWRVEFPELIYAHFYCELRNEKKDLIQVCSEFSPPTSKLVA
jgi:hypothetical protein